MNAISSNAGYHKKGESMKSTNNEVFNHVNKLFCESPKHMNTLNISYSYEYALQSADLNWYDILFAIENGYLHHQVATEYAIDELERREDCPQYVLDLAILTPEEASYSHSVHPFIDEMADRVAEKDKIKAKDKLMYIVLKWVFENRSKYDESLTDETPEGSLTVAEFIYHDFGFPAKISHFANWRCSPMAGANLGSAEKNRERIYDSWKKFIDEQKVIWKKG